MIEKSGDPIFLIDDDEKLPDGLCQRGPLKHFGARREEILTWRHPDWDPNFTHEKLPGTCRGSEENRESCSSKAPTDIKGGELVLGGKYR